MENDFELLESKQVRRAWVLGAMSGIVLFAFLPLGALTGTARFFAGPRWHTSGGTTTLGFYLPVFLVAVYAVLLSPLLNARFIKPGDEPWRLGVALALWGLPLFSFAYWLGDFRTSLHAYDLTLFLFAALAVPLTLYWRTGAVGPLALGVGLISFVPFFVVEDILGPFSPLWVYASEGPVFYSLRTLCVALSLGVVAWGPVVHVGRVKTRETAFRFTVVALVSACMLLNFGEWAFPSGSEFFPDLSWVGFLALLYFSRRKDPFGTSAFLAVAVVQCLSLIGEVAYWAWAADGGIWSQGRLLVAAVGLLWVASQWRRQWGIRRLTYFRRSRSGSVPSVPTDPAEAVPSRL